MSRLGWWLSWLIILSLGIWLRFWQLGQVPVSTYWDETAILLDAKAVALTGHDIHGLPGWQTIFPSYGDYKLPVYIWLATASVKVFGASAWALRLPSAILGIGTIILAAALVKEIFKSDPQSDQFALFTGLVVAISPWSIQFSRTAFEGHSGQFFLGLSVYFWLLGRKQPAWRWLSAIVGGLAVYCYYSVRFVWPVVLSALVLAEIWSSQVKSVKAIISQAFMLGLVPILIFGASLLPLLKSPLAQDADRFRLGAQSILNMKDWAIESNQYRAMAGNTAISRVFYHRNWLMARELLQNYADNLNFEFLFVSGDPNLRHGTGQVGLFFWWGLPALLAGLYWWANHKPNYLLVLIGWWLAALLPASVPETTPHALRSLNALLPLALLIGAGLFQLHNWWWQQTKLNRIGLWLGTSLVIGLAGISLYVYQTDYFHDYAIRSAESWQGGYTQLAQAIVIANPDQIETWIGQPDDKFFLWLMLELNLADRQPCPWLEKNYQFYQLGPYHFNLDWTAISNSTQPTLLVLPSTNLDETLLKHHLTASWSKQIELSQSVLPSYTILGLRWPKKV